ncbi:hypothetical protein M407DRAFT_28237 [Tulasnella calospora MUT 4182]|uniref:Uncharacterized protein n=1 Tax=Tulasnella calospora MUT 4182 TaxID=1051891 RepID=A0A0C3LLJ4_9AGAM|nr:hypothetical protein M407DRAFT_28237 [Tulasnella calospora MUT 4182]
MEALRLEAVSLALAWNQPCSSYETPTTLNPPALSTRTISKYVSFHSLLSTATLGSDRSKSSSPGARNVLKPQNLIAMAWTSRVRHIVAGNTGHPTVWDLRGIRGVVAQSEGGSAARGHPSGHAKSVLLLFGTTKMPTFFSLWRGWMNASLKPSNRGTHLAPPDRQQPGVPSPMVHTQHRLARLHIIQQRRWVYSLQSKNGTETCVSNQASLHRKV